MLSSVSGIFDQRPNRAPVHSTQKAFWYKRVLPGERRSLEEPTLSLGKDKTWPVLYPHGGYSILKQGVLHVIFDVGPLGYTSLAAHGHADSLSFCLAIGTDWWIVDPGTFCYHDQQAWFIRFYPSMYSSANNHLIGELTGLWVAAQVFNWGTESGQWSSFAKTTLEQQAILQIHPDGVNKEQALYYHLWVLEYFLVAWLVGERKGDPFSEDFRRTILRMNQFVRDVIPEGGLPPQIGDSDDGAVAVHWLAT